MSRAISPILLNGNWQMSAGTRHFQAFNPATRQPLPQLFPISDWSDIEMALTAAKQAQWDLMQLPHERRASFLEKYAERLEGRRKELAATAAAETGLAEEGRLLGVELPRTIDQLRQAAQAVREREWMQTIIDTKHQLRSMLIPIGPVAIFGPNNFPFAYNAISGGDFASAVAAGNAVLAKGHPLHPATTSLLAGECLDALRETGLPPQTVQMVFHLEAADGLRLVQDPRLGAVAFTGSRRGGLALKAAADQVGKPIFLEMGSLNPVILLPGALEERFEDILKTVSGSCLLGMGQFCTNPGLLFMIEGPATERFLDMMANTYAHAPLAPLLSQDVQKQLMESLKSWIDAGAKLKTGGRPSDQKGFSFENTLCIVDSERFHERGSQLQKEAFGNATLVVLHKDVNDVARSINSLEGQLAGSIFSHTQEADEDAYRQLAPLLRQKVGRLLNDKMTTGVVVSAAQNHGGPYPATGHPFFTAVGMPSSIRRFTMLACYDNVRPYRLPEELRDKNPTGSMLRRIDGVWTKGDVTPSTHF